MRIRRTFWSGPRLTPRAVFAVSEQIETFRNHVVFGILLIVTLSLSTLCLRRQDIHPRYTLRLLVSGRLLSDSFRWG